MASMTAELFGTVSAWCYRMDWRHKCRSWRWDGKATRCVLCHREFRQYGRFQ